MRLPKGNNDGDDALRLPLNKSQVKNQPALVFPDSDTQSDCDETSEEHQTMDARQSVHGLHNIEEPPHGGTAKCILRGFEKGSTTTARYGSVMTVQQHHQQHSSRTDEQEMKTASFPPQDPPGSPRVCLADNGDGHERSAPRRVLNDDATAVATARKQSGPSTNDNFLPKKRDYTVTTTSTKSPSNRMKTLVQCQVKTKKTSPLEEGDIVENDNDDILAVFTTVASEEKDTTTKQPAVDSSTLPTVHKKDRDDKDRDDVNSKEETSRIVEKKHAKGGFSDQPQGNVARSAADEQQGNAAVDEEFAAVPSDGAVEPKERSLAVADDLLDDDSDDDDSSEDGFWKTSTTGRVRAKSVIHEETVFSQEALDSDDEEEVDEEADLRVASMDAARSLVESTNEKTSLTPVNKKVGKKKYSSKQTPEFASELEESFEFVEFDTDKTFEKKRPRSPEKKQSAMDSWHSDKEDPLSEKSLCPFEDTTDDSDFSLTEALDSRKRKSKTKKRRKKLSEKSKESASASRSNDDVSRHKARGTEVPTEEAVASKKRGQKRLFAAKSTTSHATKVSSNPDELVVGERVYAEWLDSQWYWAVISGIKSENGSTQYSVLYDDGYSLDNVPRNSIITVSKYRKIFGRDPPPTPRGQRTSRQVSAKEQGGSGKARGRVTLSPQELYDRRCGTCELCTQPNCGSCSTCKRNRKNEVSEVEREVCLHNMCIFIPDSQKKQPAEGFPPNWTFLFSSNKKYAHKDKSKKPVPGLWIYHPEHARSTYRSAEAATVVVRKILDFNPTAVADFNRHVGVKGVETPSSGRKKRAESGSKSPMTLQELLKNKCGACTNCKKQDCGRCASCLSDDHENQVCLQKMCCRLPVECKAQPVPPSANFPKGYKFVIDPERKGYSASSHLAPSLQGAYGLKILAPTGKFEFYSVEGLKSKKTLTDVSADAFYEYIGAKSISGMSSRALRRDYEEGKEALSKGRCGVCKNCKKDACGRCAICTSSEGGGSSSCFQRMCYKVPVDKKAEPAVGFPTGWRFYFAEQLHSSGSYSFAPIPGLYLLSSGGKKYRSVEAAVSHQKLSNGIEVARQFYTHAGLTQIPKSARVLKPTPTRPALSNYRVVGSRVYCKTDKHGRWGIITEKLEASTNTYTFTVRLEDDNTLLEDLPSEKVLSELTYKSKTGKLPPPPPGLDDVDYDIEQVDERPRKKQKANESAAVKIVTTTDHYLVGRQFCFAWTDLKNQQKVVYGIVTECEKNAQTNEARSFKVTYSSNSREIVNSISNGCASTVPETQMLPAPLVVGGCILFEKHVNAASESVLLNEMGRLLHHWTFIAPDMRREELVESANGKRLPRLTLAARGFRLELTTKPSTIPNAGNGVFLKCTPLMDDDDDDGMESEPLVLKAGELVDMGVYGPFRIQDKKQEAVFFVKNFVHSYKCEEWAFNTNDSRFQLDITDDVTGDIHSLAVTHIPAYVNESNESICIHAEHCPDGSVHYCLGHAHKSQGDFIVPSDGTEMEVFVNYGDDYEAVRVRKGYGFQPEKKAALLKLIEEEDVVDVKEMDEFGAAEVKACVDFFVELVSKEGNFANVTIQRALVCAVVLQRRARQLFLDRNDDGADDAAPVDTSNTVNLRKVLKLAGRLITILVNMIRDDKDELKAIHASGNVDELLARVFRMHFTEEDQSKLADMMD